MDRRYWAMLVALMLTGCPRRPEPIDSGTDSGPLLDHGPIAIDGGPDAVVVDVRDASPAPDGTDTAINDAPDAASPDVADVTAGDSDDAAPGVDASDALVSDATIADTGPGDATADVGFDATTTVDGGTDATLPTDAADTTTTADGYTTPPTVTVPPLRLPDPLSLPYPVTDAGTYAVLQAQGYQLELDLTRGPMNVVFGCVDLAVFCEGPGRSLDACMISTPRCTTATPWTESSPCCPAACIDAYETARRAGYRPFPALEHVLYEQPDCVPGANAALGRP